MSFDLNKVPTHLQPVLSYVGEWGLYGESERNRYVLRQSKERIQSMVRDVSDYISPILDWISKDEADPHLADLFLNLYFSWEFARWLLDHWEGRDALIKRLVDTK